MIVNKSSYCEVKKMAIIDNLSALMPEHNYTKAGVAKLSGIPYAMIDGLFKKGDENTNLSTKKIIGIYGMHT